MSFWKNPATADLAAFQGHAQVYNLPKADLPVADGLQIVCCHEKILSE